MSITRENGCRDLLLECFTILNKPLTALQVCEFGAQRFKTCPDSNMRRLQSSRSVLTFLGAYVVSIDLRGEMGSLPLDLGLPLLHESLAGGFDLVTDFGTLEHVEQGQRQAFESMHNLCRVGGLMTHAVPCGPDSSHGVWQYTVEWFAWLAASNAYLPIRLERWLKRDTEAGPEYYVRAIFRKERGQRFNREAWVEPERSLRRVRR